MPFGPITGWSPRAESRLLATAAMSSRPARQKDPRMGRRSPTTASCATRWVSATVTSWSRSTTGARSMAPDLDLELHRRQVTGIVLAGISTSIGVESTARAANERGYELTIVTDAVTDTDEDAHLNSLRAIFPRIAELATTEEVFTSLDRFERSGVHSLS